MVHLWEKSLTLPMYGFVYILLARAVHNGVLCQEMIPDLPACWCNCLMDLEVRVCTRSDSQT